MNGSHTAPPATCISSTPRSTARGTAIASGGRPIGPMPPPEPSPPDATRPGPTDDPPEPPVEPEDDGCTLDEAPDAPGLPGPGVEGSPGAVDPPIDVDADGEAEANGSEGSGMDALTLGSGIDALSEGSGSEALIVGSGRLGNGRDGNGSEGSGSEGSGSDGNGREGSGTGSEGRATTLDWLAGRSSTASPRACCSPAASTAANRNVTEAMTRR
jgi:hypothetical protein